MTRQQIIDFTVKVSGLSVPHVTRQYDEFFGFVREAKPQYIVGKLYEVDTRFQTGGTVRLLRIYGSHFCEVQDVGTGAKWDTMLSRLSPHEVQVKDNVVV